MSKKKRPIRADTLRVIANAGKERAVLDFVRDFRRACVAIGRLHWRQLFETGSTDRYMPAKHLNDVCGAKPVQKAVAQVQEQIDGWMSNRANEFASAVQSSSLPAEIKRQLHILNRMGAIYRPGEFTSDKGETVVPEVRRLARNIMRGVMARHRKPRLNRVSPRLDQQLATIARSTKAKHNGLWITLKLPNRGQFALPVLTHDRFLKRPGDLCTEVQLCTTDDSRLSVRLMHDMTSAFAESRAAYTPAIPVLSIDFGLATLLATDQGNLLGRRLIDDLVRIDRQLVAIARHRMRSGDKPRNSARYRGLVTRVRGMLRTRVNAALNRAVALHKPATLSVERLNFQSPDLSKRMNRLVQNCGRSVFRAKLVDLRERLGIETSEVPSPYTSQECSCCHYVDRRNRRSQSKFRCLWCGSEKHADVNGARTVKGRRSAGLGEGIRLKGAILAVLTRQFCERWRRPRAGADDPRWTNPHFVDWANAARKLLDPQALVACGLKQ